MTPADIPNPGSPAAKALGCKCPRMDNAYGAGCGRVGEDGKPLFWIHEACPLHGPAATKDPA